MVSNILLTLKNLKENEYVIISDTLSKEDEKILKEVLDSE